MKPPFPLPAALLPCLLASCVEHGDPIARPLDLSPPPAALLDPSSMAPPPTDPRFLDALVAYTAASRALPDARGLEAYARVRDALRLLAGAVAIVPAGPALREPLFVAANEVRAAVARMATTYENDPHMQTALAREALGATAGVLVRAAATAFAGEPEVMARAQAFEAAARAVDAEREEGDRGGVVAAMGAAGETLREMLRAALSGQRARG